MSLYVMVRSMTRLTITRNYAAQFASRVLEFASTLILSVLIGRVLGAQELGRFTVVMTFCAVFVFASDWGVNLLLFRKLATTRHRGGRYMGASIVIALGCSAATVVAMSVLAVGAGYEPAVRDGIVLGGVWLSLGAVTGLLRAGFYAAERMELETACAVTERVITILGGVWVIFERHSLHVLLLVMIVARVVGLVVAAVLFERAYGRVRWRVRWRVLRTLVVSASPYALNLAATAVYLHSDLLILSWLRPVSEVGYYKAAASVVIPWTTIAVMLNNTLLPGMSRAFVRRDTRAAGGLFHRSVFGLEAIAVPVAAAGVIFAGPIVRVLYGAGFEPASAALGVLAVIIPLRFFNNCLGNLLTAAGRQHLRTRGIVAAAGLNVALNVLVIPRYGLLGAASTTVVTEVFIVFSLLYYAGGLLPWWRWVAPHPGRGDAPRI